MNTQLPNSGSSSSALSEPPSPTVTTRVKGAAHALHTLQIQAFLDASEDVELDADVFEDIIDGFVPEEDDTNAGADPGSFEPHVEIEAHELDVDLDISALYQSRSEAQDAWSDQQVAGMLRHLKEHGMTSFLTEYYLKREIPVLRLLFAFGIDLCPELQNKAPRTLMYFLKVAMSRELRLRDKLPEYNTIEDAVELISRSKRILILSGAGISVSCGIPDFRSRDGLYASLAKNGQYQLDDPHQMFDIQFFRSNPAVFYSFASKIYPSNFTPSPCHRFIKLIEDKGKLLRVESAHTLFLPLFDSHFARQNYTQNIDTLETQTGVVKVLQCHGSFATATCLQCRRNVLGSEIESDIMKQKVPLCTVCNVVPSPVKPKKTSGSKKGKNGWVSDESESEEEPEYPPGIMKPDITFFGEKLTDDFDNALAADREEVDLLLVVGTSLKVAPVSDILSHLPHSIPQIVINKTPIRHINPDIVLLGNADDIVQHISDKLGWSLPPATPPPIPTPTPSSPSSSGSRVLRGETARKRSSETAKEKAMKDGEGWDGEPKRLGKSHVWLFEGAEVGKWGERWVDEEVEGVEGGGRDVEEVGGGEGPTFGSEDEGEGNEEGPPLKKTRIE